MGWRRIIPCVNKRLSKTFVQKVSTMKNKTLSY